MKRILTFCFVLLAGTALSHGAILINLSAGNLYSGNTSTPFPTGGLIQLVASTLDNTFSNPTPGSFTGTSADDVVIASFASNDILGPGSVQQPITFNLSGNLNAGDQLLLRWFPNLTLADVPTGPAAGNTFGQFRTDLVIDFSDIAWFVPADNTTFSLNFLTAAQGGSNPESAGVANMMVVAVPEPSTYALLAFGLGGLVYAGRRKRLA
ncbi:MAG: PEP-CTERM sorting domain-containing protein [Chthoniobacterales bacterium]